MVVRSLNGLNGSTTNVVITNYMDAALPLEQTQLNTLSPIVLSIKGLSAMGAENQIMKVSNGVLAWATETDTTYTGTAPIVITGTTISYDNTTSGTFTNKIFGDLTMFESSLSCRNSSSSGYIRLYTNGASSTNFVDLFTPNNLTQDHTIFLPSANGILSLTTDLIQPNYGGTGKSNLSNEIGKVLRVNSNGNGYDFYTLPTPLTQYWGLTGNVLSPTSSYDLQVAEIINIGSSTVYYQLKTDTTNDAFQLTESDGTTVLKYTSNGRLDFGYSTLIGSNAAYPAGQGIPFGTIGSIYSSSIYSKNVTADDITIREYNGNPSTSQSYIRCNSDGNLTFSSGGEFATDLKVGDFMKFKKDGVYSYIFDPRQNSGTPTSVYNLISYHNNGTETAINNWSAGSGLSSHFSINFGGAMKFRFHTDETLIVGSKSFLFPILGGTLARLADIPGNSYINSVSSPAFNVNGNGLLSLGNVGVAEGGTGLTSAAFGSLLYGKPPSMGLISIGSSGDYLKVVNGIPGWVSEPNNGQWSVSSTVISPTNPTVNKLDLGSGTPFFRVERNTYGTGSHTLKNPNSSAPTGQEWFLYWRDDANITMINAGSAVGSVHLGVANAVKLNATYDKVQTFVPLEAFGDFTQVPMNATPSVIPSFTTPRFKISANGDITEINNPAGDNANAQRNIIEYHNDGTYLNLVAPSDGTTDSNYISNYIGTALKLKIGGATTVSYNPLTVNGDIVLTTPATGTFLTMPKIKFNSENDNCYMSEQFISNAPGGDMVFKIGGGDIRLFRDNTPDATAGNYQGLIFLQGSANDNTFQIYAGGTGGGSSNIYLNSTTFNGNLPYSGTSDDRLKTEETLIDNATETLMKLRPQTYMKQCHMGTEELPAKMEYNFDKNLESGLIAQEIYYNAPELRHIIKNTEGVEELPEGMDINDLQNDPDWNGLGWSQDLASSVSYTELIPYLIKSNQEQQMEIDNLKTENQIYKSIVDKLVTAKSFVDFKKSIA